MKGISFHFQLFARIVRHHFLGLLQYVLQFSPTMLCQFWHIIEVVLGQVRTTAQADLACRLARSAHGFPPLVRKKLGFALYQAQIGQRHESARMLHGFAETVWQVRADDRGGTYRVVYIAQLGEAVYVRHAFQKKATSGIATPHREIDSIRQRLQVARRLAGK